MKSNITEKIIMFFGVALLILGALYVAYSETRYTRTATYYGNGEFIDNSGRVWVYDGDFEIGKEYKLKMHTNGTDEFIYDDEILDIR